MTAAEIIALIGAIADVLRALQPLEPVMAGITELAVGMISHQLSSVDALTAAQAKWVMDEAQSKALMGPTHG